MADRFPRVRFPAYASFHGWVHYMNKLSNAKNKFQIHYPGTQPCPMMTWLFQEWEKANHCSVKSKKGIDYTAQS